MELLKLIVEIIDDKKGEELKIIDVSKANQLADYFVICNVTSDTHAVAIAHHIEKEIRDKGYNYHHTEGLHGDRKWILVDAGNVIVHLFTEHERQKYSLEKLWLDQPQIDVEELLK